MFKISRKAYTTYYDTKRRGVKPQNKATPKWAMSALKNHLLVVHANKSLSDVPENDETTCDADDDGNHSVQSQINEANLNRDSVHTIN